MFFILPVGVDFRAQRYPVVTFTLMGINTLVYLVELIFFLFALQNGNEEQIEQWVQQHFWLIPSQSAWYTYVTALFVHAGFFHLLGNMVYLYLFGACVEDTIGRWQFVIFYLIGGLVSDFSHIASAPQHFGSEIPMGGASGAISACLGGFVLLLPKTKINFRWFFWLLRPFTGEFWLPAWLVLSFWFLEDLAAAIMTHSLGVQTGTAYAAHTGGFIAGTLMLGAYKLTQSFPIWPRGSAAEEQAEAEALAEEASTGPATIYLYEQENQIGPFTDAQVLQMLQLGSLSAEAFYWEEGMADWRSINEFGRGH